MSILTWIFPKKKTFLSNRFVAASNRHYIVRLAAFLFWFFSLPPNPLKMVIWLDSFMRKRNFSVLNVFQPMFPFNDLKVFRAALWMPKCVWLTRFMHCTIHRKELFYAFTKIYSSTWGRKRNNAFSTIWSFFNQQKLFLWTNRTKSHRKSHSTHDFFGVDIFFKCFANLKHTRWQKRTLTLTERSLKHRIAQNFLNAFFALCLF